MSDASITFECKPQSPFVSSPDQEDLHDLVTISDLASVSLVQKDQQNVIPDEIVQNMVTSHNGVEDDGGGGTGVKKKRKKKEAGQQELCGERDAKPKRKREPKEPKEPKKPKKPKEPKPEGIKKPRKPREPKVPKEPKEKKSNLDSPPKARPKKPRPTPVVHPFLLGSTPSWAMPLKYFSLPPFSSALVDGG
uniref:Uncharacterized protein n=1 Tax=Sphaerodactylus townsendi TaxID=933632 RepID=A0ACB8F623_9SAUR